MYIHMSIRTLDACVYIYIHIYIYIYHVQFGQKPGKQVGSALASATFWSRSLSLSLLRSYARDCKKPAFFVASSYEALSLSLSRYIYMHNKYTDMYVDTIRNMNILTSMYIFPYLDPERMRNNGLLGCLSRFWAMVYIVLRSK